MKRILHYIVLLSAVVSMIASCSYDEARVIPRGKLSRIYAEMLMTDQWIAETPGLRHIADTTLVYEPILEKYGYDSEDYRKSVDVYMDDPERFSRILRETVEILDTRLNELKELKKAQEEVPQEIEITTDFNVDDFFPYLSTEPYIHYYDSLEVKIDTASMSYRIYPIEVRDTVYEGVRMIVRTDSLAVTDSLAPVDTLAAKDSIAMSDSPLQQADSLLHASDTLKKTLIDTVLVEKKSSRFMRRLRNERSE